MTKEQLAQWLVELDENVLQVAIMYAENYLKYGVDVTEKWNTAVRQQYSLYQAERAGFISGRNIVVLCKDCKYWHRRECGSYGTCESENMNICGFTDANWFCADGVKRE